MDMIIVDIKEPTTTLDAFADLVTAIKNSGNKHFQTFVKEVIESKRKEFYRELLTVPPDFQASQEYDVFISYSHKGDIMRTVDTLMSRLKQEGLSVFVDQHSIQPGDKWRFEIASAIKTCKAFVCVLTKRYMRSVYCNGELYETVALGKRLFPVVCEDGWGDVPGGAPVMEVVQEIQYVSLVAEDRETQLARLVQSIKGAVTPLSPVPVAPGSSDLPTDQAASTSSLMSGEMLSSEMKKVNSCDSCAGPERCNGKFCPCFYAQKSCSQACHCNLTICRNSYNGYHMQDTAAAAGPPATASEEN
ncbi:uncharacterized protein LOC135342738 [Halichondria panicea]|uniref:uncharacterized protein LOC135342738 n=1 Tax=Halichondria panicea TaxID=6063 RepID=UPI00312B2ED6